MPETLLDEVTQADREAAADYGRATASISPREADAIRRGEWDDLPRVLWFARRRAALASLQPSVSEMSLGELLAGATIHLLTQDYSAGKILLVELIFDDHVKADAALEAFAALSPEGEP